MQVPTALHVLVDQKLASSRAANDVYSAFVLFKSVPEPPTYAYDPVFTDLVPGASGGANLPPGEYGRVLGLMLLDQAACTEAIACAPTPDMVFRVGATKQYTGTYAHVLATSAAYRKSMSLTKHQVFLCSGPHDDLTVECSCTTNVPYTPQLGLGAMLDRINTALAEHRANAPYDIARKTLVRAVDGSTSDAIAAFYNTQQKNKSVPIVRWPALWLPRLTVVPTSFTLDPTMRCFSDDTAAPAALGAALPPNWQPLGGGRRPGGVSFPGQPSLRRAHTPKVGDTAAKDAAIAARAAMQLAVSALDAFDKQHLAAALDVFGNGVDLYRTLRSFAAEAFDTDLLVTSFLLGACGLPKPASVVINNKFVFDA